MKTTIDSKNRPPKEENLKCSDCGHEVPRQEDLDYQCQSRCPRCHHGQMMSRWWAGWKRTVREEREFKKHWRDIENEQKRLAEEPVSQGTEPIEKFTVEERRIHNVLTFTAFGQEAPWLGPFGACFVNIYGIRRADDGTVEFGVGNEEPPILGWVHANDFFNEWPQ